VIEDIHVTGGTRAQKKYIIEFCEWLAIRLIDPEKIDDLVFEIHVRKMKEDEVGYKGFVQSYLDEIDEYSLFEIDLDKDNCKKETLITLAHEMIHVKQMINRELIIEHKNGANVTLWRGQNHNSTEYIDQPWEHEANNMQEELVKQYLFETV